MIKMNNNCYYLKFLNYNIMIYSAYYLYDTSIIHLSLL